MRIFLYCFLLFNILDSVLHAAMPVHTLENPITLPDPWVNHPGFDENLTKTASRDIGAIWMIWNNCPNSGCGDNCQNWSSNHALGMSSAHSIYGFPGETASGYYYKYNKGFYYRELLDARYAGLQFLLVNAFGPEVATGATEISYLTAALNKINSEGWPNPVKIALMDDTYGWNNTYIWTQQPDCKNVSAAAAYIYGWKWKPFFQQIPTNSWYRYGGRPVVYFYNAGKLANPANIAAVIQECKNRFQTDFGVEPHVFMDSYFDGVRSDGALYDSETSGSFCWNTFASWSPGIKSRSSRNGITLDHSTVRWQSAIRDNRGCGGSVYTWNQQNASRLDWVLANSTDANILVLATWNDLGEGTGINRCYDYYFDGSYKTPDYFMQRIRTAQGTSGGSSVNTNLPNAAVPVALSALTYTNGEGKAVLNALWQIAAGNMTNISVYLGTSKDISQAVLYTRSVTETNLEFTGVKRGEQYFIWVATETTNGQHIIGPASKTIPTLFGNSLRVIPSSVAAGAAEEVVVEGIDKSMTVLNVFNLSGRLVNAFVIKEKYISWDDETYIRFKLPLTDFNGNAIPAGTYVANAGENFCYFQVTE